jgi:predicted flavoprotein YhiN
MTLPSTPALRSDVVIVGAGAAGLATAIFLRRASPCCNVFLLDGVRTPGAKILVSGGSRCNVTNVSVSERDFWGGPRSLIRPVLRAMPVRSTVEFFKGIGVTLHEETDGKLFPDSNRSRDVLTALLKEAGVRGAPVQSAARVEGLRQDPRGGFTVVTGRCEIAAKVVVLATGGR